MYIKWISKDRYELSSEKLDESYQLLTDNSLLNFSNVETPEYKNPEIDLLKQQLQAASDQNDFLEDCIAEMAEIVYA